MPVVHSPWGGAESADCGAAMMLYEVLHSVQQTMTHSVRRWAQSAMDVRTALPISNWNRNLYFVIVLLVVVVLVVFVANFKLKLSLASAFKVEILTFKVCMTRIAY